MPGGRSFLKKLADTIGMNPRIESLQAELRELDAWDLQSDTVKSRNDLEEARFSASSKEARADCSELEQLANKRLNDVENE